MPRTGGWQTADPDTDCRNAMPDPAHNASLTVELVQAFAHQMALIDPTWQRAYLRIAMHSNVPEAKASYVGATGVEIVDVRAHKPFFHWVTATATQLRDSLPAAKPFKVALVVLSSDLSYEVKYDDEDERRWAISKLNGGTGVPVGH